MLMSPFVEEAVQVVIEEGIKVITTGAGNPGKYMQRWLDAGIKVIPVVPSVALARKMEKLGAFAVIAEGGESGGHVGDLTTMALVPQVVDAVNIPVIAAGGIADGRQILCGIYARRCRCTSRHKIFGCHRMYNRTGVQGQNHKGKGY